MKLITKSIEKNLPQLTSTKDKNRKKLLLLSRI
jgi:hypothetical protein